MTIGEWLGGRVEKLTTTSFVLVGFNFMLFRDAHSAHWATVDGIQDWVFFERTSHTVVSSTYLTVFSDGLRSFAISRKSNGPSLVP